MNIIGLDALIFGVDDIAGCSQYLIDYGLSPIGANADGGRFEALDGTAGVLARADDAALPAGLATGCMLRKTVFGVADNATLQAIATELRTDREVMLLADGSLQSVDDAGFVIGFQCSVRKPCERLGEVANAPGSPLQRAVNHPAVNVHAGPIQARTLSHLVYFVPDVVKAEAFYVKRLGFRCTDRFVGVGPFLQPAGTLDHHTHFLIGAPAHMQGVEHFTFHFGGPTDVMQNGTRFLEKGYQAFWGPGRHIFGSNWFWYFNGPLGGHIEMDADMDLPAASWQPREAPLVADASQAFLRRPREKWSPGPATPKHGDYA